MVNTLTTLSPEAKQFYDRNLLERANPLLVLARFAQNRNIPRNSGNQVSYRRFNKLSTITTPLVEGVTPSSQSLSITEITGTAAQYGGYVTISDAVDLLAIDPVITESTDVLGEQAGESIEEIARAELVTGTSVVFANAVANRATLAAVTDRIDSTDVRLAIKTLYVNNAKPFRGERNDQGQGGLYVGVIHPEAWFPYIGQTLVTQTLQYSDPQGMYTLELPVFDQVAWYVTTMAPKFAAGGAAGADVYGTLIFGQNAYGMVDVAGTGKFDTIVKPIGSGGTSDPLNQRGTVAWKSWQLPKILNNNFMVRIEST